jgi:O-antigen ligase
MAVRVDWPSWVWPLMVAGLAAPVGLLAGVAPEFAIAAALALAFLLLISSDLATGVVLFTGISFFETVPGLGGASLTKFVGLLLALAWLGTLATRPDVKGDFLRVHPRISGALIMFLAWNGLSYAWSEHPASALDALSRFALNAILFLLVFTAIRRERDVLRVFWAFIIGASLATIVGVLSGSGPTPYGEAARISSSSDNANELAAVLVASFSLAAGLALVARRSPALRTAAFGAAAISLAGIVLTVSRSGLIALFVAVIAAIVFAGRWRPRVLVMSALVVGSAVLYFAAFAPATARERVTSSEKGGHGREDIWKVGWRMVEAHPVRGVGAGNFSTSSIHYLLVQPGLLRRSDFIVDTQKVAHNAYLQAWAETGVIGLGLFLAVILGLLACSLRAIKRFERDGNLMMEVLARAQLVGTIGLLSSLFFSSDEYNKQLWLLLAMGPAMLAIASRHDDEPVSEPADVDGRPAAPSELNPAT